MVFTMIDSNAIVRRQVQAVEFRFYSDQDVRNRSVVEVTSPRAFDPTGTALKGGLCDPRMGPSDIDSPPCPTCALRKQSCPGHFGHVELAVPIHHPLLVSELLTLLRCKCLNCHNLRGPPRQLSTFRAKFYLLYTGRLDEFHKLENEMQVALAKRGSSETLSPVEAARVLDECLRQYQPPTPPNNNGLDNEDDDGHRGQIKLAKKLNSYERGLRNGLIKECLKMCKGIIKCPHCDAISPKVRQDSSNKFFRAALSNKNIRINRLDGIEIKSALEGQPEATGSNDDNMQEDGTTQDTNYESDDDVAQRNNEAEEVGGKYYDSEDDEETGDKPTKRDNFMHTQEIQAQLKRTWKTDPFLMNCLFGAGSVDNFDPNGYQFYFMQAIPVPPNRFRPSMAVGPMQVEHSQNKYLSEILQLNLQVRTLLFAEGQEARAYTAWIDLQTKVNCYMDSSKDPSATPIKDVPAGIRQVLERKEGLFRKNMMGKRVDFACRSVISPDPYVGTNEIGLPLYFATVLTYPTPVTPLNIKEMRHLVEQGPGQYPGARWVEMEGSKRLDLSKMKPASRSAVAAMLLTNMKKSGKPAIVGRQLRDGDYVLMNRQPTLHKPGIMAHRVRILHNPSQKTIRMHYANCNTYNADFDGDEMNCHFPQSDIARAEAMYIARTDLQYIVPTDGSPLRGLIQDHVVGGVMLTKRDTLLEKWEYQQLLFACLASLPGLDVIRSDAAIEIVPPALIKPRELWTGKQVITTLLLHLRKGSDNDSMKLSNFPKLTMERKAKTPGTAFGTTNEEHLVVIKDSELLRGVLDKSAFGATDFSLVHSIYEAYGPGKAGIFLNALSRLFTAYVQYFAGHSCRTEDLMLTKEADAERRKMVQRAYNLGARAAKAWADSEGGKIPMAPIADTASSAEPLKPVEIAAASAKIGELLSGTEGKENFAALDGYMQSQLNPLSSAIVKKSLPDGLVVKFPFNTFGVMTTTGAKGSIVNQSQVICALGQQALEGRRVPRLSSGRTLPSFAPYDAHPRADGFVMDRFLTGVRPQEYYFHCMAGREGLVDTAVKTSRSGYLQRCLVKHLEELKVCYDFTVRNAENGVVQFLYGEDGLDPTKAPYLASSGAALSFLAQNHESVARHNPSLPNSMIDIAAADASRHSTVSERNIELFEKGSTVRARRLREGTSWERGAICRGWFDAIITKVNEDGKTLDLEYCNDGVCAKKVPVHVDFAPSDAVSNRTALVEPIAFDPVITSPGRGHLIGSSGACLSETVAKYAHEQMNDNAKLREAMKAAGLSKKRLSALIASKYSASLCAPGEAVGSIAAQSIGEPSTQMTLNTFHLAGSAANVTLGIPRLREIIMTASKELKTPTMSVPLIPSVTEREALRLTRRFKKLTLMELISGDYGIAVTEKLEKDSSGEWSRAYHVKLKFHPAERIKEAFGLSLHDIAKVIASNFVPLLSQHMRTELKRSAAEGEVGVQKEVEGGEKATYIEEIGGNERNDENDGDGSARGAGNERDDLDDDDVDDDDNDDDVGEEDGADGDRQRRRAQSVSYDDDDDSDSGAEAQEKPTRGEERDLNQREWADSLEHESKDILQVLQKSNTIILQPLRVDPANRPLLMVGLVEQAAKKTIVRQRKGIDQAFINEEENGRGRCLQTAGVNFEEMWNLKQVDHDRLMSNDIWAIRCAYGVEAARSNIGKQISSVFGVYGIEVDPRHLSLISDYMTFEGNFKAMSRIGMEESSSAFLQMSFETTATFLKQAAMTMDVDTMSSPSANICLGRPIRHGTGAFEVLAA